jgi:hypothetical protein
MVFFSKTVLRSCVLQFIVFSCPKNYPLECTPVPDSSILLTDSRREGIPAHPIVETLYEGYDSFLLIEANTTLYFFLKILVKTLFVISRKISCSGQIRVKISLEKFKFVLKLPQF